MHPRDAWLPILSEFEDSRAEVCNLDVPYDALLVVSFGGPESPEDVMPFLENVLRGKPVPRERMLEVAEHYYEFGGVSPINEQCRALIRALVDELNTHGPQLPVYWGNRNWHPLLARHVAADERRWHSAGARLFHFGLQLVFRLSAVPREHHRRAAAGG